MSTLTPRSSQLRSFADGADAMIAAVATPVLSWTPRVSSVATPVLSCSAGVADCHTPLFLSGFDALTPSFRNVNNKFSVKYFLNLVLIDEEDRRYFKQQEIVLFRK